MLRSYSIFFFIFTYAFAKEGIDLLVHTKPGPIKGLKAEDGDYLMFLGIPYGKLNESDPLGPFGASFPHPPFETVFEANDDTTKCPQQDEFTDEIVGTLDCLRLNIYVPNNATLKSKLPVLVWMHGGGLRQGYAGRYLYGPKYLVRHDIILVTFNYRVGPYGFFCLDIPEVPGNQGLRDQVLAFRWLKNNIEAFGGDANKITLMGSSIAAAIVEIHILSKFEKLFDKAIIQSGTTMAGWIVSPSNTDQVFQISKRLGYVNDDLLETLLFLSKTDPILVAEASAKLKMLYGVCVEKQFENVESFMTEYPEFSSISSAKVMPVLIGTNSREQLNANTDNLWNFYSDAFFRDRIDLLFHSDKNMERIVRKYYIGDEKVSKDVELQLVDFLSDFHFHYPTQKSILRFIKSGAPVVYQYLFSYSGGRNFVKNRFNLTGEGACHADELGYLFDMSYMKVTTEEDKLIINRITTLWTNFVKYGNPTPETSKLIPIKWIPSEENVRPYFEINTELSLGLRPFHKRMAFWELFSEVYHEKKIKPNVETPPF